MTLVSLRCSNLVTRKSSARISMRRACGELARTRSRRLRTCHGAAARSVSTTFSLWPPGAGTCRVPAGRPPIVEARTAPARPALRGVERSALSTTSASSRPAGIALFAASSTTSSSAPAGADGVSGASAGSLLSGFSGAMASSGVCEAGGSAPSAGSSVDGGKRVARDPSTRRAATTASASSTHVRPSSAACARAAAAASTGPRNDAIPSA